MKRIGLWTLLQCVFVCVVCASEEEIDVTQPLRIHELIPQNQFLVTLAIDPALPSNFVAMNNLESEDGWTYWGEESALRAYFKASKKLESPLMRLSISPDVRLGVVGFNEAAIRKEFAHASSIEFGKMGIHPYCRIIVKEKGANIVTAWVGTNSSDGEVFQFQLLFPYEDTPTAAQLEVWDRFFKESKGLPSPLIAKAYGQEMHIGYTLINVGGFKAKLSAERRVSDRKIQFAFEPLNPTIKFYYQRSHQSLMESEWHKNKAFLEVEGVIEVNEGDIVMNYPLAVLIKETEAFSSLPILKRNIFLKEL